MVRYLAIATAIVVVIIVLLTGVRLGMTGPGGRTRHGSGTGTPGPAERAHTGGRSSEGITGFAAWALSALPECFTQTREVRGPRAYVLARIPSGLVEIPQGVQIRSSDCTVTRRGPTQLDVKRGSDVHLEVAAVRAFLIDPGTVSRRRTRTLVLIVKSGAELVLRRYRTQPDTTLMPEAPARYGATDI